MTVRLPGVGRALRAPGLSTEPQDLGQHLPEVEEPWKPQMLGPRQTPEITESQGMWEKLSPPHPGAGFAQIRKMHRLCVHVAQRESSRHCRPLSTTWPPVFLTREQAPDRRLVAGVGGGGSARIAVAPCWGVVPATQNHAMFQLRLPELYLQTNYKTKNKHFSKSLSPATLTAIFLPMLSNLKPLINREPQLMKSAPRRRACGSAVSPSVPASSSVKGGERAHDYTPQSSR